MSLTAESARGISPRSQIPDTPVRVSGGSGDAHHHALSVASLAPVNGFWVWVNTSRGDDEDDDEKDLSSLSFEILRKDIKPIRRAQAGYIERAERDWQMKFTTRGSCWRMSKTGVKEGCDRLSRREERAQAHRADPGVVRPKDFRSGGRRSGSNEVLRAANARPAHNSSSRGLCPLPRLHSPS
jgi:hypothetical protein